MTYTGRLFGRIIKVRINGAIDHKMLYYFNSGNEIYIEA